MDGAWRAPGFFLAVASVRVSWTTMTGSPSDPKAAGGKPAKVRSTKTKQRHLMLRETRVSPRPRQCPKFDTESPCLRRVYCGASYADGAGDHRAAGPSAASGRGRLLRRDLSGGGASGRSGSAPALRRPPHGQHGHLLPAD